MAREAYKVKLGAGDQPKQGTNNNDGSTASTTKTTKTSKVKKVQLPPVKNPAKFGKANPVRDIFLLTGSLGFLFLMSWVFEDVGTPVDMKDQKKPGITNLKQYQKQMYETLTHLENLNNYRFDCDLYLAPSSIRGSGLGIFAGKNYSQGETIFDLGWPFLTIKDDASQSISLPPYSLVLKHHPSMANVKPSTDQMWTTLAPENNVDLITTQDVMDGDELFLDFTMHPHTVLPNVYNRIPKLEDYKEADEIVLQERITFKAEGSRGVIKKREREVSMGMRMTQKAVKRYNPMIANLLPLFANSLQYYGVEGATTAILGLQAPSRKKLAGSGVCLSDINNNNVASRKVPKGDSVRPVPLYIYKENPRVDGECDESGTCLNSDTTGSELCLSFRDSLVQICPFDRNIEIVSSPQEANVEFKWSPLGGDATKNPEKLLLEALIETYFADLAWDAVALRDVEEGEKLFVYLDRDTSTGKFLAPDNLMSDQWKTVKQ